MGETIRGEGNDYSTIFISASRSVLNNGYDEVFGDLSLRSFFSFLATSVGYICFFRLRQAG